MNAYEEKKIGEDVYANDSDEHDFQHGEVHGLQRRLGNRQIQLIAIGGSIGTALFVSIGGGLNKGGPGGLILAYFMYTVLLGLVNNGIAEMTIFMPVEGGFIRLAGKWVDEAFGFTAGWNFIFYEALLIPFEITGESLPVQFGYLGRSARTRRTHIHEIVHRHYRG